MSDKSKENKKRLVRTVPIGTNLTPSEIQARQEKLNSLPTIEQINQDSSLLPQLYEFPEGINDPSTNAVYTTIVGYTADQLKKGEASYHINNLSVIPQSLTTPDSNGYMIYEFPNWLSSDLCDQLIARATPNLINDTIFPTTNCMVVKITNSITNTIQNNMNTLTNLPTSYYETMIVRQYSVGGLYKSHVEADPLIRQNTNWDRVLMAHLFLNDNYTGGEKIFTKDATNNRTIVPQKGKLLLYWVNQWTSSYLQILNPNQENAVLSGTKWTASFAIHSREKWIPDAAKLKTVEDNF
jgi:2OG-Fe(II) oxygenase superfamily